MVALRLVRWWMRAATSRRLQGWGRKGAVAPLLVLQPPGVKIAARSAIPRFFIL